MTVLVTDIGMKISQLYKAKLVDGHIAEVFIFMAFTSEHRLFTNKITKN